MAFLDQWQNYTVCFSGILPQERLVFLPDYIYCLNEVGEIEMLREGFPADRLVKLGHPYLSSLINLAKTVDQQKVRQRLNLSSQEEVMMFVSEPILEHYGMSRGYDQYEVLGLFFEWVASANQGGRPLIKLHPKDSQAHYEALFDKYAHLRSLIVTDTLNSLECLLVANAIYGMTSIMLIEAYVLGKQVVSLQPNLQVEDPLVLSRHGLIPLVTSKDVGEIAQRQSKQKTMFGKFEYASRE